MILMSESLVLHVFAEPLFLLVVVKMHNLPELVHFVQKLPHGQNAAARRLVVSRNLRVEQDRRPCSDSLRLERR